MGCYINKILECKEEGQHINESTTTVKDVPFPKTIGGERQEGKEEVDDHNTTPPMPHCP